MLVGSHYSCPQMKLSSEITENFLETIHDAATFLKLVLVMDNLFEYSANNSASSPPPTYKYSLDQTTL